MVIIIKVRPFKSAEEISSGELPKSKPFGGRPFSSPHNMLPLKTVFRKKASFLSAATITFSAPQPIKVTIVEVALIVSITAQIQFFSLTSAISAGSNLLLKIT